MPAACWPNEPHYRLFVLPRVCMCVCVRVRVPVFVFNFSWACSVDSPKSALSARWLHKQFQHLTCPLTAQSSLCSCPSLLSPLQWLVHSGASTHVNWRKCRELLNGDCNSFKSPIMTLIAFRQILLLFIWNRVHIPSPSLALHIPLSVSCTVCLFHACRLFKNKFQFPFLPPFAWQFVYVLCIHMSLSLSLFRSSFMCVCVSVCVFVAATEINI